MNHIGIEERQAYVQAVTRHILYKSKEYRI